MFTLYVLHKSHMDSGYTETLGGKAHYATAEQNMMLYGEHTWGHSASISDPCHPLVNHLRQWKRLYALKANESITIAREQVQRALGETAVSMERALPRERYHWHLCPEHLTADEEWLASPIYEGSEERLESGMQFQLDLIPSRPPLGRVGCEDGLCLADEALRRAIEREYPVLYQRMQARRAYMLQALGIRLSPDVLPLSGGLAYYRPYLLSPELVLRKQ